MGAEMSSADQIMTASPHPAVWRSDPYTIAEIDTHHDAGRIWATLEAMKASISAEVADAEYTAEYAAKNARKDCRNEVLEEVNRLLQDMDDNPETINIRVRIKQIGETL